MANNKITKRMNAVEMLADEYIMAHPNWVAYLEHEIELMDKKKSSPKAKSESEEHSIIKENVISTLGVIGSGTVTDIQNACEPLKAFSNQKVSSLMRQLVEAGMIVKTTDKKRSIFSLA